MVHLEIHYCSGGNYKNNWRIGYLKLTHIIGAQWTKTFMGKSEDYVGMLILYTLCARGMELGDL